MIEEKELKYLKKFYINEQEGLQIAKEALEKTSNFEFNTNILPATGTMDWRRKDGGIRTVGKGISGEFIRKGFIDFKGRQIKQTRDLAVLAQVFRNPSYETLRLFYLNKKIIVGFEGITSKLPSSAVAFLNYPEEKNFKNPFEFEKAVRSAKYKYFYTINNRMKKLGADGFYMLHNHPTGHNVQPSMADIQVTKLYIENINGFKGHVIIDSNKFSFIDKNCNISLHSLHYKKDKLLTPSIPHSLLGQTIGSSSELASISKHIQVSEDYSAIIYTNSKLVIRGIQEVPDGLVKQEEHFGNYLRGRMYEFGSSNAFLVTSNEYIKNSTINLVKNGYLADVILADKKYVVSSVREEGIIPTKSNTWMGKNSNYGIKVNEPSLNL